MSIKSNDFEKSDVVEETEMYDFEHSPEFTEEYLKRSRELFKETNPELVELMDRLKKENEEKKS